MKNRTLEQQRIEFINQKFLTTPLAGLIIWTLIGLIGIFFSDFVAVWPPWRAIVTRALTYKHSPGARL